MTFDGKYDKIELKKADKYPELLTENYRSVWPKALLEITEEIAKEYNLIFIKVK